MKQSILFIVALLAICALPAVAQDERFRAGELDVSPFATYVDKAGDDWGAGAAVTYFISRHLGFGGATYWTDFDGKFIDNVAGEGYFRLPVIKSLAPYAVGSIGYEFETEEVFETLGGGVDFRVMDKASAFGDIQWRFADDTDDGIFLRLGIRIPL